MAPTAGFEIRIPQKVISGILDRVRAFRWPVAPKDGGWRYGTDLHYLNSIASYWGDGYDWPKEQAALNAMRHFRASIDGLDLHYVRERARSPRRLPVLLLHGWPSSFFEFSSVIQRLAHPERFGGSAESAVDVVAVSLPGFAFSGKPAAPIGPRLIAGFLDKLMTEVLGYDRYVVHGGDWGAVIASRLGFEHAGRCAGIHMTMVSPRLVGGRVATTEEQQWLTGFRDRFEDDGAYFRVHTTRPQTLNFAMSDSPVGAAAWMLEKFAAWSDLPRDGNGVPQLEAVYSNDQLLTNIMIYLVTDSFGTATWLYRGFAEETPVAFPDGKRVEVPVGIAALKDPGFPMPPRSLVEKAYNVTRWSEIPRGGHFPGFEVPELLAQDIAQFASQVS